MVYRPRPRRVALLGARVQLANTIADLGPFDPTQRHCRPRCRALGSRQRREEHLVALFERLAADDPGRAE